MKPAQFVIDKSRSQIEVDTKKGGGGSCKILFLAFRVAFAADAKGENNGRAIKKAEKTKLLLIIALIYRKMLGKHLVMLFWEEFAVGREPGR